MNKQINRNRPINTENKFVVARGEGGGRMGKMCEEEWGKKQKAQRSNF